MANANIVQLYKDKLKEKPVIPIGDIAALYDGGTLVGDKLRNALQYINNDGNQWFGNAIEFNINGDMQGHGGYIDFHYNGSTADYTTRLIENASGRLAIYAPNDVYVNNQKINGVVALTPTITNVSGVTITVHSGGFVYNPYMQIASLRINFSTGALISNSVKIFSVTNFSPPYYLQPIVAVNSASNPDITGNVYLSGDGGVYAGGDLKAGSWYCAYFVYFSQGTII